MKKKALSICLALALFFALPLSLPMAKALSLGSYTLAVSEGVAKAGESVSLSVTIEADAPFSSMQGLLVFDQTRLELALDEEENPVLAAAEGIVVTVLRDTFEEYAHKHGIAFSVRTEDGAPLMLSGEKELFGVSFLVKEDAALGDAKVQLISYTDEKSATFVSAEEGVHGNVSYQAGKLTVLPEGYTKITGDGQADGFYTVKTSVDGKETAYTVNRSEVQLPGQLLENGRAVIAWKIDDKLYAPGERILLPARVVLLEAVTVEVPTTVRGAAVKITPKPTDTALRFKARLSRADYDALVSLFGESRVSWGMIAAPQQNIDFVGGACTYEAFAEYVEAGSQPYVCYPPKEEWENKVNEGTFSSFYVSEDEEYYTLIGAIAMRYDANLRAGKRFNAVGYISVRVGTEEVRVYGDVDFTAARDVAYVVEQALAEYYAGHNIYTDDQVRWLKALKERCEG